MPNPASWVPFGFLECTTWWMHFHKKMSVVLTFTVPVLLEDDLLCSVDFKPLIISYWDKKICVLITFQSSSASSDQESHLERQSILIFFTIIVFNWHAYAAYLPQTYLLGSNLSRFSYNMQPKKLICKFCLKANKYWNKLYVLVCKDYVNDNGDDEEENKC